LTETSKEALRKFLEYPEIKSWYNGVGTGLKESTRGQYLLFLMRYIGKENPASFLKRAQEKPREVAIEIKSKLGEAYKQSMTAAHLTKYALRSFLDFHEVDVQVKAKIKVRRVRKKPELSWEDADRIIQETDEPYRSLFKFMKWSGLGEDEVMEIQASPNIQRRIETQRSNDKPYVKIDLSPRKANLDEFFTLTPKQYMPQFPLKTKMHRDRGGSLIDPHDMQNVWRRAAKKAKLWQVGLGPHTLRSTFKSQCGKSDVKEAVSEFCMGHGGGDKYGYAREVLNEQYVASELRKLWAGQGGTSEEAAIKVLVATIKAQFGDKLSAEKKDALDRLASRIETVDELAKKLKEMNLLTATLEGEEPPTRLQPKKRRIMRPRTARNGGTPVDMPYETRIVGEEDLVPLLNEGWEIVKELSNARIVMRRANAA
jgi:hypothetical protein